MILMIALNYTKIKGVNTKKKFEFIGTFTLGVLWSWPLIAGAWAVENMLLLQQALHLLHAMGQLWIPLGLHWLRGHLRKELRRP